MAVGTRQWPLNGACNLFGRIVGCFLGVRLTVSDVVGKKKSRRDRAIR